MCLLSVVAKNPESTNISRPLRYKGRNEVYEIVKSLEESIESIDEKAKYYRVQKQMM
jgi:hypothetical protein